MKGSENNLNTTLVNVKQKRFFKSYQISII